MVYTDLELQAGESDADLMARVVGWVEENNTSVKRTANVYLRHSPCEMDDFKAQALISAYDAARKTLEKGETDRFKSYFHRIFTSQCYMMTHKKVHSRTDIAPHLAGYMAEESARDSSSSGEGFDINSLSVVDERNPFSGLSDQIDEMHIKELMTHCLPILLQVMRPREREVWQLILNDCDDIAGALGVSRQRWQKLRDSGLQRISAFCRRLVPKSTDDEGVLVMDILIYHIIEKAQMMGI